MKQTKKGKGEENKKERKEEEDERDLGLVSPWSCSSSVLSLFLPPYHLLYLSSEPTYSFTRHFLPEEEEKKKKTLLSEIRNLTTISFPKIFDFVFQMDE
ncbi:hypothetical protein OUZ56_008220 [Daphnia magna]|uniref:Uncharacterized protein n=1 Tax=Daphnia magna TaxID=35525 RepID=A0ABR0ACD4_9CRUS|nr:hypothetical protein OUZ56_008220 [Daphnia magna]